MKKLLAVLFTLLLALSVFANGTKEDAAANYPNQTVEATVGWSAGGGGDIVFRALAQVFPKYANGQTMVIKNVPGASGVTGAIEFLDASKDGYSIMHWNNASMNATHLTKVPVTGADTFTPVAQIVASYNYLVVPKDSKYKNLQDFVADIKANPGKVTIANAGVNGGNHMAALLFEDAIKGEVKHVAYSGGGPAITGLLGGEVDATMANAPEGITNVENGQLRILAVFSDNRYTAFPDVPTAKESGVNLVLPQWRVVVCPPGTPEAVVNKLASIIEKAVQDPQFVDAMTSQSVEVVYKNPKQTAEFLKAEDKAISDLINKLGLAAK